MLAKDKVNFYGVFKVKSIGKNNEVLDEYVEKNLIMNTARVKMANLVAGNGTPSPINKFVLGTEGHNTQDFLTPKMFDSTRTNLFSEESSGDYYVVSDDGSGVIYTGGVSTVSQTGNVFSVVVEDSTVTFTFNIPVGNGNSSTDGPIGYTEAALYSDSDIFSMKTFPIRAKENTVSLEITWSIIF